MHSVVVSCCTVYELLAAPCVSTAPCLVYTSVITPLAGCTRGAVLVQVQSSSGTEERCGGERCGGELCSSVLYTRWQTCTAQTACLRQNCSETGMSVFLQNRSLLYHREVCTVKLFRIPASRVTICFL